VTPRTVIKKKLGPSLGRGEREKGRGEYRSASSVEAIQHNGGTKIDSEMKGEGIARTLLSTTPRGKKR